MAQIKAGKVNSTKAVIPLRAGKVNSTKGVILRQGFASRKLSFVLVECDVCVNMSRDDTTCGPTVCTEAWPTLSMVRGSPNTAVMRKILEQIQSLQKVFGKKLSVTVVAPKNGFEKVGRAIRAAMKGVA